MISWRRNIWFHVFLPHSHIQADWEPETELLKHFGVEKKLKLLCLQPNSALEFSLHLQLLACRWPKHSCQALCPCQSGSAAPLWWGLSMFPRAACSVLGIGKSERETLPHGPLTVRSRRKTIWHFNSLPKAPSSLHFYLNMSVGFTDVLWFYSCCLISPALSVSLLATFMSIHVLLF